MGIGGRIAELLHEKRMSQKELSERACVSEAAVSHYLKGDRVPNSSTLANIAAVLGTTSSYLLQLALSSPSSIRNLTNIGFNKPEVVGRLREGC